MTTLNDAPTLPWRRSGDEAASLELLRTQVTGSVILDGDTDYDTARKVWNGEIDRRPAVIVRVASAGDVAAALGYAQAAGLEVSVKGGGHNFAGAAVCDGGLVIDLALLRSVSVDPVTKRARAGGGALNVDLDAATQAHGLAVPAGTVSDTGIGGLTLGGGFGWLTTQHGLSIDNLVSAEVVLADGNVVRASADSHPDLFWALRGGGGNFGVVTEFEYQLHDVGPLVSVGMFFWPVEEGVDALAHARAALADLPPGAGAVIAGLNAPPAPFVPEQYRLTPCFALIVVDFGHEGGVDALAERVRAGVPPRFDAVTPMPYVALQQMLDGGGYPGVLAYEKSIYLESLSDEVLEVLAHETPQKASPMSMVLIFPMSGAYCAVPDDATAFGGPRRPGYVVSIQATCPVPELMEHDRPWVRSFWQQLVPLSSNVGGYVNFMSEFEGDRVRAAYGAAKYDRLAEIKANYDPANVFHHNANITPAVPRA